MLKASERVNNSEVEVDDSVTLDFDTRKKVRIKSRTDNGYDLGIFLQRGHPLFIGDILKTDCGLHIEVKGLPEEVSTAYATDWDTFSKICYHLGNRHTILQIGLLWVRYKPDHVLDELCEKFGLSINHTLAIFAPETGAYHTHAHSHN
ncbi:urease accessory protein UreE [Pseudoalteromonas phenolica]|uniref:Urease accessory protein UreE n=1 Tax=Pseudoalteromonas phenolica TaxID=161398 RepID=A0A0S2K7R2_9GAMM|nr:urease accessory protein UreE [Pseudoalteromonas phenolica]ALO44455.1 Urease accessory protein UreE [Pseudoalteromonas phenolica]MBE0357473.1 urease accessory protein [Pseudoalteromonas phenolica O-BC30]RXF04510.1 urease accessory protein UreE [Pseudoalteromonas phenolica O-BC30]